MARGNLPVTKITRAGVAVTSETTGVPADNHSMINNGKTYLLVRNSNGASTARVVTVHLSGTLDGQTPAPKTYSIAAAATKRIGPWPTNLYSSLLLIDVDNAELKLSAYSL